MTRLAICTLVLFTTLVSCADKPRDNIFDPGLAPTIEISPISFDSGTVLIEWRYLSETGGTFKVTRTVEGAETEIARVPASEAPDWTTLQFRDSILIGDTRLTYRVASLASDGSEISVGSGDIRLEGTESAASPDLQTASIQILWAHPPSGATGFDLSRTHAGGSEIVFSGFDAATRAFVDTSVTGGTVYTYVLETRYGGGSLRSVPVQAGLYVHTGTGEPTATEGFPFTRTIAAKLSLPLGVGLLSVGTSGSLQSGWDLDSSRLPSQLGQRPGPELPNHDVVSLTQFVAESGRFLAGLNPTGDGYFVVRLRGNGSQAALIEGAAAGGSRVGMAEFGQQLMYFVGNTIRTASSDLLVDGTLVIEDPPIGIDTFEGAIWLFYEDRILRSNVASSLSEVSSWDEQLLPPDITVTNAIRLNRSVIVLDGHSGLLHTIDASGQVTLSWQAPGEDHLNGDIVAPQLHEMLFLADGMGKIHYIETQLPLASEALESSLIYAAPLSFEQRY